MSDEIKNNRRRRRQRRVGADRPRLASFPDAFHGTGIPATSWRDHVMRGVIPAVRIPGSRRIWLRWDDIDRLIDGSTERMTP